MLVSNRTIEVSVCSFGLFVPFIWRPLHFLGKLPLLFLFLYLCIYIYIYLQYMNIVLNIMVCNFFSLCIFIFFWSNILILKIVLLKQKSNHYSNSLLQCKEALPALLSGDIVLIKRSQVRFPFLAWLFMDLLGVHGAIAFGPKIFTLVWRCHQLLSGFLAKGHLPRVSRWSLMIRVTMKSVYKSPEIRLAFSLTLPFLKMLHLSAFNYLLLFRSTVECLVTSLSQDPADRKYVITGMNTPK